jgi:hypothetical protein
MFAWRLVTATMIATDRSYWELFLVQQILRREMLLGDQIQNMVAQLTLQQFGGGKLSIKEFSLHRESVLSFERCLVTSIVGLGCPLIP